MVNEDIFVIKDANALSYTELKPTNYLQIRNETGDVFTVGKDGINMQLQSEWISMDEMWSIVKELQFKVMELEDKLLKVNEW